MITFTPVFITPEQADAPVVTAPIAVHGPYRFLPQAEYVARILRRLNDDAQIVAAGRDGPWWVQAVAAEQGWRGGDPGQVH
jgi:hypothetical protein